MPYKKLFICNVREKNSAKYQGNLQNSQMSKCVVDPQNFYRFSQFAD